MPAWAKQDFLSAANSCLIQTFVKIIAHLWHRHLNMQLFRRQQSSMLPTVGLALIPALWNSVFPCSWRTKWEGHLRVLCCLGFLYQKKISWLHCSTVIIDSWGGWEAPLKSHGLQAEQACRVEFVWGLICNYKDAIFLFGGVLFPLLWCCQEIVRLVGSREIPSQDNFLGCFFFFLWRFLGIFFNPALGCMCSFL